MSQRYICASVLVYENDPRFGPSGIVFPHMHHNSIPYQRQHASHAVHPLYCCVHVENEEEKYLDYNWILILLTLACAWSGLIFSMVLLIMDSPSPLSPPRWCYVPFLSHLPSPTKKGHFLMVTRNIAGCLVCQSRFRLIKDTFPKEAWEIGIVSHTKYAMEVVYQNHIDGPSVNAFCYIWCCALPAVAAKKELVNIHIITNYAKCTTPCFTRGERSTFSIAMWFILRVSLY